MKYKRIVVWFRNDLRVSDNETLSKAIQQSQKIIPLYCFDPRMFEKTELGFPKTGNFRAKFLLESLENLRSSLKKLGGDLVILKGKPEEVIPEFSEKVGAKAIFYSQEVTSEEKNVEKSLEKEAFRKGIEVESHWQSTLYHLEDLPFPVKQTPEVFTQFRKEVEKLSRVRSTYPTPKKVKFPSEDLIPEKGELPTLNSLGLEDPKQDSRSWLVLKGGEESAFGRLQSYFWEKDCLKSYKKTRNGLLGMDYSTKFSSWLSLGCISPRSIFEEVKKYEKQRTKNDSTYWVIFELVWRDYFRFIAKKHGDKIFQLTGIKNQEDSWSRDRDQFDLWVEGETGVPFVDANMRELKNTGFMSNRGRQIVASFLINDLGIDWTWGASYFESLLIDYDVCSNWGNWMYVGGVGNDPRENRHFNILRQAKNYDPKGEFVRHWVTEIQSITGFDIHQPWDLSTSQLRAVKIQLGHTYPQPMVDSIRKMEV
ncbi:deoxyribodipyrimidine photo-lyase (single-stranded DNA-specific) [Algoriphagus boseongensis]|uniref:Cryptochrome DASH n=1 Tax=Algoriphagus boseongensis TaxID=1442587 RepID=A0A4R6T4C7_9BACT|nr:DASH family cryptochrome [Algoriphagus boseongensis]TDQ17123.1 deoxyribodipyrimidine photo-lyase (single-stranded DNA-specific) [Algoriphagus boseongensis]